MKKIRYIIFTFLWIGSIMGFAQDTKYPFAADVLQFKENDKINPPPRDAILFIGSSSFTLWKDVKDYFPGYTIINRAFGGSTLLDQIHYAEDIVIPYSPRQIVIYCGENDFAYSDTLSPGVVTERFKSWFYLVRSGLPDVRITFVSMKPSPSRWYLAEKFLEANFGIRLFLELESNVDFVNVWDKMLNENNLPDSTLFLEDMLHMNAAGYKIWQDAIGPELIK